ncbi:MAG: Gfo/Idh/MocA family protein [Bacteriovoracaceae bacterium]
MVRVALVGHGFLGKWHAQKIEASPLASLDVIIEPNESSHEEILEKYPNVKICKNEGEELDNVDALIISTPTQFHFEWLKVGLERNLHLFCEKPLVKNKSELSEIRETLSQRVVQVGHSERCHEMWEFVKEAMDFSSISNISIDRSAAFKGRATDVSVVEDLMIHDIDLLSWLFQMEPEFIGASGKKVLTDNYDDVKAYFKSPSDAFIDIRASRVDSKETREILVTNHQGVWRLDLLLQTLTYPDSQSQGHLEKSFSKRDHLAIEQEMFYRSILHGDSVFCSFDDGAKAVLNVEKVTSYLDQKELFSKRVVRS